MFDLFEALMAGNPQPALAITDRMYERGADLGVVLQDLLELVHTLTRLKSVPALRESQDLPEAERTQRRRAGRPAAGAGAGSGLADAAEGGGRGRNCTRPAGRGRDGADPAVPCRRPAATRRPGTPPDRGVGRHSAIVRGGASAPSPRKRGPR